MALVNERELLGPTGMARVLEAKIAELQLERAAVPRSDRRPINQRLHTLRGLLTWCRSRAGYVETPEELGLLSGPEDQPRTAVA